MAGDFVDWIFVETLTLAGPVVYLMIESASIVMTCERLRNGDGPLVGDENHFAKFFDDDEQGVFGNSGGEGRWEA